MRDIKVRLKKIAYLQIILMLFMMCVPATLFADTSITLNLSKSAATVGESVTASGTANPNAWVPIKVVDSSGSIVVLETPKADATGNYSLALILPATGTAGTWSVTAGEGSDVASKIITVDIDTTAPILSAASASGITNTEATINYTSDEAGIYYYLVYAAADTAPDAAKVKAQGTSAAKGTAAASAAVNTANVTGLVASTAYKAYVIVVDASNNASSVASIPFTTTAAQDTTAPIWTSATLTASGITQTGLTLTWSVAADNIGVTNYKVYKNGTAIDILPVSTLTSLTYDVSELTAATKYSFKVEAGDAAGNWSINGPSTSITSIGVPPTLQKNETISGKKILLTFDKAMADPKGKQVEFSLNEVDGDGNQVTNSIISVGLNSEDKKVIELTIKELIKFGYTVTVGYAKGSVTAADGGVLETFVLQTVTNHVPQPVTENLVTVSSDGLNKNINITEKTKQQVSDPIYVEVPSNVSDATIIVSELLNVTTGDTRTTNPLPTLNINVTTEISQDPVKVAIPAGTTISAPAEWDGTINVPTVKEKNTVTVPAVSGKTTAVESVIEVGYGDIPLTFSKAVRILIPGQAGKEVGYSRGEVFTPINTVLSADNQATADSELSDGEDGYINVGSDLVIWTKHFTKFVTYAETAIPTSGGSGGGGGGPVTVTPPPGTIIIGGNNTEYNQKVLNGLSNATTQQKQVAQLPSNAPVIDPEDTTLKTLTTNDGIKVVVPAGAARSQTGAIRITVAMGTITSPPKTESTAVVLDPLKYQRQFGVEGQTDGSIQFTAPVTITFPIATVDLPAGTVPQQLAVYWWDPSRNDWAKLGGIYDSTTNSISVPTYHFSTYAVMADTSSAPNRLAGFDRFETAIAVAEQGWKSGANNVVLANAYSFPDALAAGPLAYKLNAPILLTDAAALTPSTLLEIEKLAPKKITLVGGTAVISQAIQDLLSETYGKDNVIRYGGWDRYETAAIIAAALGTKGKAVIANAQGNNYQDALAITSYAAYNGIPILFTEAAGLPSATVQALEKQKVSTTIVVGGEAVVPAAIYDCLPGATRYGGWDLYETATAIATGLQLNANRLYVVTGLNFPDALVAGNLAAKSLSPLIMVDRELPTATKTFLTANKAAISELTVVGGEAVITASQESTLRNALR